MCQERKPHKHAELIKAWAEGAEIQVLIAAGDWVDTNEPAWNLKGTYRVKPEEPIVRYACASFTCYIPTVYSDSEYNKKHTATYWRKCKTSSDNIKATFCPDTGKLLSVEMI